ncbi:MAG: serine/threonine protein kinase [Azospirillaceae bacterium]
MAPSDLSNFLAGETGDAAEAPAADRPAPGPDGRRPDEPAMGEAPSRAVELVASDRFEILREEPLAQYDRPAASAYAVRDRRRGADLIAYVTAPATPPRLDVAGGLRIQEAGTLLRLVEAATIHWPDGDGVRPVLIYERPVGDRIMARLDQPITPMSEVQLTSRVVKPLIAALKELKLRRIFHGAINPTNLYLTGNRESLRLGDCLTGPPGVGQPGLFEPIERAMAEPIGRGTGSLADDLFAVGATVLVLALGRDPTGGVDEATLLDRRLTHGSYAALIGDHRLNTSLAELVRGLLVDDAAQRWTLDDLELWFSGRRLSPKQTPSQRRASRAIRFEGESYWSPRALAAAMAEAPQSALAIVDSGELQSWLRRSIDSDAMAGLVDEAVRTARSTRGGTLEERTLARVLIALDPAAPIRWRGRAIRPEGLGPALADSYVRMGEGGDLIDLIAAQLPMFWIAAQPRLDADQVPAARRFDRMRGYLERPIPGYGAERCLYDLAPGLPCQSAMLAGRHVADLADLMHALEDVAADTKRPSGGPIDRHVAAFAMSRHTALVDRKLPMLSGEAPADQRALTMLDMLIELQVETGIHPLPALCGWMVKQLGPVVDGFASRTLRERLQEELERQARTGVLRNLHALVGNDDLFERDRAGLADAQRRFALAGEAIARIDADLADRERLADKSGKRIAATAAGLISSVIIAGVAVGYMV